LSRGAAQALFLDAAPASLDVVRRNLATLGEVARGTPVRGDATRPPPARTACTLAFLDPPYGKGLAPRALTALAAQGWFATGALVVVEERLGVDVPLPPGFEELDKRVWGDTQVLFAAAPC